jgi:hypothetical protein
MSRPGRFPKVNDVMLAEALRQLIPVAEFGVRTLKTNNAVMPFRRAEIVLDMWVRQERGRVKTLGGSLPPTPRFEYQFFEDPNNPDPGQIVPAECQRPKRQRRKAAAVGPPGRR